MCAVQNEKQKQNNSGTGTFSNRNKAKQQQGDARERFPAQHTFLRSSSSLVSSVLYKHVVCDLLSGCHSTEI